MTTRIIDTPLSGDRITADGVPTAQLITFFETIELMVNSIPQATPAEFQDASSEPNNTNKQKGIAWIDSETGRLLQASGSLTTDVWVLYDGTTVYTPV